MRSKPTAIRRILSLRRIAVAGSKYKIRDWRDEIKHDSGDVCRTRKVVNYEEQNRNEWENR